ncbi:MAG: glbO [Akkermansiaceae bacterium]|nr:glbO [Akkermansiaceae bacterium]
MSEMEDIVAREAGPEGLAALVAAFYRRIRTDDLIGPMYPPDDLEAAEVRLRDFLLFRFLGDATYLENRGHPRLRMRHFPFEIGEAERDRWLQLMDAAMDEIEFPAGARAVVMPFFGMVAESMRNH